VDVGDGDADGSRDEQLEGMGRALDEAVEDARSGQVDPELLDELGMNEDEFRDFVEKYSRKYGDVREMADRTAGADRIGREIEVAGSDRLERGRGSDRRVTDTAGSEDIESDDVRKLNESRRDQIDPAYRKQVEDYFRAVSEGDDED
jgi:hypothetical protein